jgi:hypothetical protein
LEGITALCKLNSIPFKAGRFPSIVTATARIEPAPLHQQFRQAGDCGRDAPRLVGSQVAMTERPYLQIIATVHRSQAKAVGVSDFVTVCTDLFDPPWRRKSAFLAA